MASDTLIGTSTERLPSLACEIRMGLHLDRDRQIARRRALGARLALALEPKLGAGIDARWDLDDQALGLAGPALDLDRRLATADGRQEWDGQIGFQPAAARAVGPERPVRTRPIRSSKMLAPPVSPRAPPP